jgi:hypothetical protein
MTQQPAARVDSLRSAIDSVFTAPEYAWRDVIDPWAPMRRAWMAIVDSVERLRLENPMAYRLLVWSLIAALLLIVGHALWIAARTVRGGSRPTTREPLAPATVARDAQWYAHEAKRLAAGGRYVEAMQADYVRLMLELDGRRIVRFHPSRTPHEYVRDPSLADTARGELQTLVRSLYRYAFGRAPCDADSWRLWQQQAQTERYAGAN